MASEAAPQFDTPLRDPDGPAADRVDRARSVSSDLEAIFGSAASAAADASAPRAGRVRTTSRAPGGNGERPRLSLAGFGGIAAAALAGIAAGSLLVRAPQAHPQAGPTAGPALPAIAPPPARLPVELVPPPQALPAAEPPLAAAPPQIKRSPPITRARARAPTRKPKAARGCCSYVQVQAADRRLRAAYAVAVRAGVSRSQIVAARDRWSSARRRAAHDPVRLVANYRDIADDLNRAAARAHPARVRHARFQPRYAAWWR